MTNPIRIAASALWLLAALAGCDRGGKADDREEAAGRILPGTVSDSMIETDRLEVEAPIAAPTAAPDEDADPAAPGDEKAATTSRRRGSSTSPAATPAASPAPRSSPAPDATASPE